MAKKNKSRNQRNIPSLPETPAKKKAKAKADKPSHQAVRETVESLVIAFVLAFLFRTFQAEAFVIPTGSMAPTLMGRHKDVFDDLTDERYKVNASQEDDIRNTDVRELARQKRKSVAEVWRDYDTVAGVSPSSRYTSLYDAELPRQMGSPQTPAKDRASYGGDRILVNKYVYSFTDPKRWDVIVFKFPGNSQKNYIKRLVGLPNEALMIYQGDVFAKDEAGDYQVLRKPPKKVMAMRQLVHDTNFDAAALAAIDWPLRWQGEGWQSQTPETPKASKDSATPGALPQTYVTDGDGDQTQWLRYRHRLPGGGSWGLNVNRSQLGKPTPHLITDFNAYNTGTIRSAGRSNSLSQLGPHWTGDLMLDTELQIQSASGSVLLELVEAGSHFRCEIDLATGEATLSIVPFESEQPLAEFSATASTPLKGTGSHEFRFANFDDTLHLWIDDQLVDFNGQNQYDGDTIFGRREDCLPQTSDADPGDLAPVGIASRGAKLAIDRLQVWRDLYYIADSWQNSPRKPVTDFQWENGGIATDGETLAPNRIEEIASNPDLWSAYALRQKETFNMGEDQFFVMGDNSAESLDARLWADPDRNRDGGYPSGPYVQRSLIIGKAVCVYWPHSWYSLPGTGRRVPAWPNFGDMRVVR